MTTPQRKAPTKQRKPLKSDILKVHRVQTQWAGNLSNLTVALFVSLDLMW